MRVWRLIKKLERRIRELEYRIEELELRHERLSDCLYEEIRCTRNLESVGW